MNLAQKYGGEKIPAKPYEGQVKVDPKLPNLGNVKPKPKK